MDQGIPKHPELGGNMVTVKKFCDGVKKSVRAEFKCPNPSDPDKATIQGASTITDAARQIRANRNAPPKAPDGSEEGFVIEAGLTTPPALRFNADGFGSQYDAAGLVRPRATVSGGQSTNGDNSFNGVAPRVSIMGRTKMSDSFTLSYGARIDYAHYGVNDSNSILKDENQFSLHRFTASVVVRGALTLHKHFAVYGEVAPGLRVSTGSGRIATGAPESTKDENAFTADKVPTQIVAEGSLGFLVGSRDSIHANVYLGWVGSIYDFTQQTVLVEGASSPVKVTNDGGILTGGANLVIPFGGKK